MVVHSEVTEVSLEEPGALDQVAQRAAAWFATYLQEPLHANPS